MKKIKYGAGQVGRYEVSGIAAFAGAAVTAEVHAGGLTVVESVDVFWMGTPNANEPLSLNETVSGSGTADSPYVVNVPASGTLTVTRAAGTTADGKFAYVFRGY